MNITDSKILILFFTIIILLSACDESSELGLEVQPNSDKIEIFNNSLTQSGQLPSFILATESVDSLRSDEPSSLLLGSIDDPIFGENFSSFFTKPDFIDNKLREVNNYDSVNEEKNQVYMYNNRTKGLIFEDRKIEYKLDDNLDEGFLKFQQKKGRRDQKTRDHPLGSQHQHQA